jgi:hypothetical protein
LLTRHTSFAETQGRGLQPIYRNIEKLFNFDPTVTDEEIHILLQIPPYTLVVWLRATPLQFLGDARPPVTGPLQGKEMNGIARFHVHIGAIRDFAIEAIEVCRVHMPQFVHLRDEYV